MLKIGEVAKIFKVKEKTIRFYESKGLIKPFRSLHNYRLYSKDELAKLQFILCARMYKLTIKEIRALLDLKKKKGEICKNVVELFTRKKIEIEEQIKELKKLNRKIEECLKRPVSASCCSENVCEIIERR